MADRGRARVSTGSSVFGADATTDARGGRSMRSSEFAHVTAMHDELPAGPSDLVDADLLARPGVKRAARAREREWVECAPRRVARSATVLSPPCPANGLYRRRARDWDPGFRMRARSQESARRRRALAVSLPDAPTRLGSLSLSCQQAAGARLPAYS